MYTHQTRTGNTIVMGMGKTGLACIHFLTAKNISVCVMDNRITPPGLTRLKQNFPHIPYITGHFDAEQLEKAAEIIISPGLSPQEPALNKAKAAGVPIISEIELFARYVNAPVVAITGSNGKSTVTTLLGEMAKNAAWNVQVGGNLGTPALALLSVPAPDLYIIELSSFQLEHTFSLNPKAAIILNISADHQDRYADIAAYITAKQRIFQGNGTIIMNADETVISPIPHRNTLNFSLQPDQGDFRISDAYIVRVHNQTVHKLLATHKIRLQGTAKQANALAALALGEAIGLPLTAMLDTLQTFKGLAHRCAWIAHKQGVDWYNDSKGTNVGATIAAIQSFEKPGKIILIAGGEGKGADFTPLTQIITQHCRACVLIGRDARLIADVLPNNTQVHYAHSMTEAVTHATRLAHAGDTVLLSPACASFDMFKNYEHRGTVFEAAVNCE